MNENRIFLETTEIKVDADPAQLAAMIHSIIHNEEYRKAFEKEPVVCLADCGITVPEHFKERITPQSIDQTLKDYGGDPEYLDAGFTPGVSPSIRVGTRPGTMPVIRVGVQAAVETTTFVSIARNNRPEKLEDIVNQKNL